MVIRDPVHGDILLSSWAARVIDTPEFQRLRGIRQLGTAYLVYPGCHHTRFEHSLGTYWIAKNLLERLAASGADAAGGEDEREAIALAALLHDVAHVPFGHTLEDEWLLFPRHDDGSRLREVFSGRLGDVLEEIGVLDRVWDLLDPRSSLPAPWPREIVSGTVDADLFDYVRRDAQFAGLRLDYDDRLLSNFVVAEGRLALNLVKGGRERADVRSEFFHMLHMRYVLTERLYYHHAKIASSAMIARMVEWAAEEGRITERELLRCDDAGLLERLRRAAERDVRLGKMLDRLARRDLFKRGVEVYAGDVGEERRIRWAATWRNPAARRAMERWIARRIGCAEDDVILYCQAETFMKEVEALCLTAEGLKPLGRANLSTELEVRLLEQKYRDLWRLYVLVPAAKREACRAHREAILEALDASPDQL
ncbi:MAG: HD domain-containing protein [Alicyclobacillaceae bacterium]|nr:HD domain-containing protein [Alicyclobacillaceae bacterium]